MAHGKTVEPKILVFTKKVSSKAIYIVQMYFLGEAAVTRALMHFQCRQQHSSQERPTVVITVVH